MEIIWYVIWSVILIVQTICDIKWKKIPSLLTFAGVVAGIIFCIINQKLWSDIVWGLVPGVVCVCYSLASREALGMGDSLLLCALGLVMEVEHMLLLMMLSFIFAAFGGLFMLVILKKWSW